MKTLKTLKILLIKLSFLGLAFQGCAGGTKTKKSYPTAIGSAVSLTAQEEEVNNVSKELSKIVQIHLDEINQKEATSFSQATNYCEISGLKDSQNSGNMQKITTTTNYQSCKSDNNIQNGNTIMTYEETDEDGRFPKALRLQAQNDYNFNNIKLKEGATVTCKNIRYNSDQSLESMVILINGTVEYNTQTYTLEDHQEVISF